MPSEGPGRRYDVVATKATTHGAPVIELNHAGIAAKSSQAAPMAPSVANAVIAQQIAIGEDFVIMLEGDHDVAVAALPGGAAAGDRLFIKASDNTLALAATALTAGVLNAGYAKFGLIDDIDTVLGRAHVNLTQRSSF